MKKKISEDQQMDKVSVATVIGAGTGFIIGILIIIVLYQVIGARAFTTAYPLITLSMAAAGGFGAWFVSRKAIKHS